MLERFKNRKIEKKTIDEHTEDALYREVWEEVNAQKTYDFVKRNSRLLISAAVVILIAVVGIQLYKHVSNRNRVKSTEIYETAAMMAQTGNPAAQSALLRAAKASNGGMSDLAMFDAAMNAGADKIKLLEQLSQDGATRDFRDLATLHLATIRGDKMSASEFEKFLAPLQTKRSPYYFTGLLMIAQKYIADGAPANAEKYLDKILSDADAPSTISGVAQMISK